MPMKISDFQKSVIGKIKEKFEIKEFSKHHIFYEIYHNKRRVAKTYCSHGSGSKEISDDILQKIKRQLNLDNIMQLYGLKNCPMTAKDYFQLLKEKNVISD